MEFREEVRAADMHLEVIRVDMVWMVFKTLRPDEVFMWWFSARVISLPGHMSRRHAGCHKKGVG